METVAQLLRERVEVNHFNGAEVARRSGISPKHLSGLMTGHARGSAAVMYRLGLVLGPTGLCQKLLYTQALEELALLRANAADPLTA